MTLSALLVCTDKNAAQVLDRVLKELNIRVESCPDFARAAIRSAQERYDAIIVDGATGDGGYVIDRVVAACEKTHVSLFMKAYDSRSRALISRSRGRNTSER